MLPDTAIGDDGFGCHARAPFERRQLPAAGAETGFHSGNANLARANANFGRVGSPIFQINHCFRRGNVACYHKGSRQLLPNAGQHALHAVGVAMGNVDGDVIRRQTIGHQLVNRVVVRLFNPQRNGCKNALCLHGHHKCQIVQVKTVHDIKIAIFGHPDANVLVDHCFHVGWYHRDAKVAPAQLHTCIAFRPAVNPAFAGQQQNVVVIKNFHGVLILDGYA